MAEVFQCSWATGTNLINSSPTAPEDAWVEITGEDSIQWHKDTDATGWNSESHYAHCNSDGQSVRIAKQDSNLATFGMRFGFKVISHGLSSGLKRVILFSQNQNGEYYDYVIKLYNNSGTLQLEASTYAGDSAQIVGTGNISLNTWYQIEFVWTKNTSGGFKWRVWNEAGDTLVIAEQTLGALTTRNSNTNHTWIGDSDQAWVPCEYKYDIVYVDDTNYPGSKLAVTPSIDQEGFRFRNDDGDEANATWAADQDANLTAPLDTNLRLRMIRNANGDPGTAPFQIEYSSDGNNYSIIPVYSGQQSNNFTANNTWTCPSGVNSVVVECWGAGGAGGGVTANGAGGGGGGGAAAWNTVSVVAGTNYTIQVGPNAAGGTGAGAKGVNSFFSLASNNLVYCLAEGGNGGTSQANGVGGAGGAIANCVGSNTFKGGNGGPGYNASGNYGGGGGGGAGNNANGTNASNQVGAAGGNALGGTGGNGVAAGSNGNTGLVYGGGGGGAKRRAASGSYSGGNGAAGLVRLIYTPSCPIILANSANIAAGGNTNTTGQLTAPANKNANNFEAGRISDDTNPLATIDMGANSYSEDEWCLKAQAPAANNNVYYFRITSNGVAFNSYSFIPQWTIGLPSNNNKTVNLTDSGGGADGIGGISVLASMSDSGIGADATPIGVLIPTQSDAGIGGDALASLLASMGISDTGAGADLVSSILISLGITDSGAGVDTIAEALANLALTDAGVASDAIQAFFLISLLDSGTGADLVNAIAASVGISDSGAGADALLSVGVALGLSDIASGTDIISALMGSLSISDIGTAIDVIQAFFLVALYDSGVGADEINNLANSFGLSDVGSALDTISVLGGNIISISDTATAQDVISGLMASLSVQDTASGADIAQAMILISTTDSATGVDSIYQVLVQSSITDTGTGVETPSVTVVLAVSDAVSALDSPTVLATINLSDSGSGVDLIDVIKQAIISILDAGVGADQVSSIQVFIPVSDSGAGVDVLPLLQAVLSIVDLGSGVDIAINLTLLGSYNRLVVTFQGKGADAVAMGQKGRAGFAPKHGRTQVVAKKARLKIVPKKPGTEFTN